MPPTPKRPARSRHTRSAAARVHVPARVHAGRAHGLPSPRRLLAAQVVAWHNRHPLARRISRRDLGGYGVLSLPFSPPLEGEGGPARFPMFDDLSLIPGLSRSKVVAMALAHGWDERPGADEWPMRQVPVARGWDASQARPIHLLTVALKRGRKRSPLRLLIGRDVASSESGGVMGHRLLSRPRMALASLALLLPALLAGWGLKQLWPGGPATRPEAQLLVAQTPRTPGAYIGAPPPGSVMPRATMPPPNPSAGAFPPDLQAPPAPAVNDIAPPPAATAAAGRGPRVGTGIPVEGGPETRAAAPNTFRLIGLPQRDPAALRAQAQQLEAALQAMGRTGSQVRMDVVGTPEGDALSVGPLANQTEAERVARRLAARGITLKVTEQ
ncbi:hypothetical protein [Ideonella sp.]|uniref:hypothetical protein n=1 Tax=Ideonella sp. TaxID=1929293 RepID=UPI002B49EE4B|nr:hypothetical protein [Ideonella sp.]